MKTMVSLEFLLSKKLIILWWSFLNANCYI